MQPVNLNHVINLRLKFSENGEGRISKFLSHLDMARRLRQNGLMN